MKRFIASLLVFAFVLSLTGTALSASESDTASQIEYAADVLSGIDIYRNSGSLSAVMSRIEFVRELSNIADKENNFIYSEDEYISDVSKADKQYVAAALQNGIIRKSEDGKFYPDKAADVDFAAYAFVAMAGYVEDLNNGTHVLKANALGIMKDVDLSGEITKGSFILMLYNYIDSKCLLHTKFGGNERYEVSDETVLEKIFGIEKFDARLISSSYSDMTGATYLPDDYISLQRANDGVIERYKCGYVFDSNLMGRNLTVFYDKDAEAVRYMIPKKRDKCILDIKGSDFSHFDLTSRRIYYSTLVSGSRWDQSYRERSIVVPINTDIIYNGQFTLDHNFVYSVLCGNENINIGRICLFDIDGDSKADLMRVEAYSNVVVKSVNTDKEALIDSLTGKMTELHVTDDDYIVTVEDTDGNRMSLKDIKKYDVVSIYTGKGSRIMIRAVVSRHVETDSVISADTVNRLAETENGTYYLSCELANSGFEFSFGREYKFLLDVMGNIAKAAEDDSIYNNIGSVIKTKWSKEDETYIIDIFTANGEFAEYKASEKLKVDGCKAVQGEKQWTYIDSNGKTVDIDEKITKGIIQFELNQKNEIKKIIIPKENAGQGNLAFSQGISNPESVFSAPERHVLRYKTNGKYFIPSNSGAANSFIVMKSGAKIMTVPADTITSDRESFCKLNKSLKNDANVSAVGYTFNSGTIKSDLVVIVNSGSVNIEDSPYYVVMKKYRSMNLAESPALALKCMNSGGSVIEFVGSGTAIPQCDVETGKIINNDVSVSAGDVVKVALDNFGEISAIAKAYDCETKTGISINPSYWYGSKRFVAASVYDIDEDAVSYILGDTIDSSTNISAALQLVGLGKTKAVIVKPKGSTSEVFYGEVSDAIGYKDSKSGYSRFILSGAYGEASFVVFYLQE